MNPHVNTNECELQIGDMIRKARKKAGLTQQELAEKIGFSTIGVQNWERNIRNPSRKTLIRISNAIGVPLCELYGFGRYTCTVGAMEGYNSEAHRRLVDLIIEAKRTYLETEPFYEYLAQYLMDHGVRILDCGR